MNKPGFWRHHNGIGRHGQEEKSNGSDDMFDVRKIELPRRGDFQRMLKADHPFRADADLRLNSHNHALCSSGSG